MALGTLSTLALANKVSVLEKIIEAIETDPPVGEAEFADAVAALVLCGVRGTEIARRFNVKSSCITRWTKNGATPHPVGRKVYARHLPKIGQDHLAKLRAELGVEAGESAPNTIMAEAA